VAGDHLIAAGLRALAFRQTGDDAQRIAAFAQLSDAIQIDYRGVRRLHFEFGLAALAQDPIFLLAENALIEDYESAASLLDIARFELRVAAFIKEEKDAQLHRNRAEAAVQRGIKSGALTRRQILADAELAPLAPRRRTGTEHAWSSRTGP